MCGVARRYWAKREIGRAVFRKTLYSGMPLERAAREGESPVREMERSAWVPFLSTTGHEESCRNLGGPPSKAKYGVATDSA